MTFVARASRLLAVPPAVAFDCLADHDSWARWMPALFRPVGEAVGRLSEGARMRVKISGVPLPISLRVTVLHASRELRWVGGVPGVLFAEHRFTFEPKGEDSVEVRSEEEWFGFLAALLRPGILPRAEEVGRGQLGALAAEAERRGPALRRAD
jgi:hypothetical protein